MRINRPLTLLFLVVWRPILGQGNRDTCEMGKNSGSFECQTAADLERLYVADEEAVLAVLRDSPHVASATAAELNPLITKAVKNGHARVLVKLVELGASPNGEGNVEKGEVRGPGRDGPESIAVKVMDKMHPLMTAMFRQDEACVRTLLELGCDPEGGMTPSVPECGKQPVRSKAAPQILISAQDGSLYAYPSRYEYEQEP